MSFENFFGEAEFDYELEKQKFIDNMDFLKSMSVQEQTLYKKWEEFNKDEKLMSIDYIIRCHIKSVVETN